MMDKICIRRVSDLGRTFDEATVWFGDLHFSADVVNTRQVRQLLKLAFD